MGQRWPAALGVRRKSSIYLSNYGVSLFPPQEKWSALYDVRTILLSIQSLLAEPNNESPLNVDAAELWSNQTGTSHLQAL